MEENYVILFFATIIAIFCIKLLFFIRRCKHATFETYSNDMPEHIKNEIDDRNTQRILSLWGNLG